MKKQIKLFLLFITLIFSFELFAMPIITLYGEGEEISWIQKDGWRSTGLHGLAIFWQRWQVSFIILV